MNTFLNPTKSAAAIVWSGVLALALFLVPVHDAVAAPNFSESSITVSSESPPEGSVATFKIVIKNTGDAPAEASQIRVQWPLMGHMIKFAGLDNVEIDYANRSLSGSASIPAGGEHAVDVDVLAPRHSGGDALGMSVRVAHYASSTEHWVHKTVTVDTRIPDSGTRAGSLRISPAGIAVVVWLIVFVVFWLVIKVLTAGRPDSGRLGGPTPAVAAIMIALGFWAMFAVMAWRDYQVLTAWPQSSATILSRRTTVETSASSKTSGSGSKSNMDVLTPEFALQYNVSGKPYDVEGRSMISTGFDTGSALHIGGKVQNQQEMSGWVPGAVIPCWYNPADPADVVVRRGFGGAYLFALFPLPVFWMGLFLLKRRLRST